MSPKIIRILGLICCVAAAVIFVLNYTNTYYIGSSFTPFLLLGVGILLLVRARLTRS
jgi:predicted membrane chloride channel (bestrophin family)